jgi:hypothetical protein
MLLCSGRDKVTAAPFLTYPPFVISKDQPVSTFSLRGCAAFIGCSPAHSPKILGNFYPIPGNVLSADYPSKWESDDSVRCSGRSPLPVVLHTYQLRRASKGALSPAPSPREKAEMMSPTIDGFYVV